jgi:hypothetical protein
MKKAIGLVWITLAAQSAFAGQSIAFGPTVVNYSVPAVPASTPWFVEFYIHDWSNLNTQTTYLFNTSVLGNAVGLAGGLYASGGAGGQSLMLFSQTETQGPNPCAAQVGASANLPAQGIYVRYQHVPATSTDECEVWDVNGNRIGVTEATYTAPTANGNGMALGGSTGFSMAFFRICTGVAIGLGAKMPTTAGGCPSGTELLEWKFDGNLNDSSGNGYTASTTSGNAEYVPTPNQNIVAVVKTMGAPFWSNWVSLRAGFPAQLDGTASLSQADASNAVSCFWQILTSPTPVTWNSHTSCTPTLTGLVFGDYGTQLTVTDSAGNQATATQDIGSVATDSNGVVVQANSAADAIFGPMMAFGRNPWGLADYWALRATTLRFQDYQSYGLSPTWPYAAWEQPQTGTISYTWDGVGMAYTSAAGTTVSGSGISSPTAASFTVADITKLDVSELPTRVYVHAASAGGPYEEIWICSASGNTVTVCYDGRGWADPANSTRMAAQTWAAGSYVGQYKITGSGTHFLTTICQGGAHSPVGLVTYSTGTIALTAGSPAVAGTDTSWGPPSVVAGDMLRVSAAHGGSPFVFLATIQTVTDDQDLALSRPFPSDADSGSYSYRIISTNAGSSRYGVLHYTRATDGSDAMIWWPNQYGCESDLSLYLNPYWDVSGLDALPQTAKSYTYMDQNWWVNYSSTGGLDFYGEDLAHRALYLRSGLNMAQTAANMIGDMWTRMPMVSGMDIYAPLFQGGFVIGGITDALLSNTGHQAQWTDLRGFGLYGASNEGNDPTGANCNSQGDNRDTGYGGAWLSLLAAYDPSPSRWQTPLANWYSRENVCRDADNSWSSGFYFSPQQTVAFTNKSAVGTGTNLPASLCGGVSSGTGVATNGSGVITGFGFSGGDVFSTTSNWRIAISGTRGGQPFTQWATYTLNSGSQITLFNFATWQGDTGSVTWMIDNLNGNPQMLTFGQNNNDPMLHANWSCIWNSSSQITLQRPWNGPSGTYSSYQANGAGYGTQPYMLGIKQAAMRWGSQAASTNGNAVLSTNFLNLVHLAGNWEYNSGFDPITSGFYYLRGMNMCEPITPASMGGNGNGSCYSDWDPYTAYNITAERVLSIENSHSLRSSYEAQNGSPASVSWGDVVYGSCFGNPAYTTGGLYAASDGNTCDSSNGNLNDTSIHAGKWTGFFFGMGMAHQWPAMRLGGVSSPVNRTVTASFNLGSVANATGFAAVVTFPSGAQSTVTCSTSPCSVSADARQGSPVVQWRYLGAGGRILAQSDPAVMTVQ